MVAKRMMPQGVGRVRTFALKTMSIEYPRRRARQVFSAFEPINLAGFRGFYYQMKVSGEAIGKIPR